MHLVQLLIPLYDNDGNPFPRSLFDPVRHELTETFGGVTAFVRAPAAGFWKQESAEVVRDDVIMYEVMAATIDRTWWTQYRRQLEARFKQDEMLIRSSHIERL